MSWINVSLTTALQILITFSFNVFIVFPSDLFFCYFLKLDLIIVGVSCSVNKFFTKTQQSFHCRGFRVMLYLQKQKAVSSVDKEEIAIVTG